jgi:hypothetical protein
MRKLLVLGIHGVLVLGIHGVLVLGIHAMGNLKILIVEYLILHTGGWRIQKGFMIRRRVYHSERGMH